MLDFDGHVITVGTRRIPVTWVTAASHVPARWYRRGWLTLVILGELVPLRVRFGRDDQAAAREAYGACRASLMPAMS